MSKSMRIAQVLERDIRSGRVAKGARLASESALTRRFSVSRNTVRKGLEELARQGLIATRSGIGSFVTYDGETIDSALGWTLALSASGAEIETRLLDIQRGACPASTQFLGTGIADFLRVDRLRVLANTGIGISLERSRLPWRESFAAVLKTGLINDSLSDTLDAAGLVMDHGEEWAEVLPSLAPDDARRMGRESGEPMLRLRRVTRTVSGELIELVDSILDPSRFGLHLAF